MSILHLNQIKSKVAALFKEKIDLSDIANENDRENFFLTRALAAYVLHYRAQADVETAAKAITDGYDDNGLDAIHYDVRERRLYLVQSKWFHNGTGEPGNGDVKKFIGGIRDLFNLSFDRFNDKIRAQRDVIIKVLNDPSTRYEAVIVYPSVNKLSEHSARDLEDLADEMNDPSELLTVAPVIQADLYNSLTVGISGEPINLEIGLKSWGRVESPRFAVYGRVDGHQISSWWKTHGTRLFSKNLRGVLGDTEVNEEVRGTIDKAPEHFWYFNNGITITAKNIKKTAVGGGDTDFGVFHCEEASIVNGAQTVGTIGKYGITGKENHEKLFVQVRIISLEHSEAEFGEAVTKTNNRQNRIENRDFVALDPEQNRIRTELAIDGMDYHVLREETSSRGATSFDLVESTTALACASEDVSMIVQLKREIGKLWENIDKRPYKQLFNASISGLYVWRCVRIQRLIDHTLDNLVKHLGLNTGREYGVAVHGNRMVAGLVFAELKFREYQSVQKDIEALIGGGAVVDLTTNSFSRLRDVVAGNYGNALIPTLFKNQTKCKNLFDLCRGQNSPSSNISLTQSIFEVEEEQEHSPPQS